MGPRARRHGLPRVPGLRREARGGPRDEPRGRRRHLRARNGRRPRVRAVLHERGLHDGLDGLGRGREDHARLRARHRARPAGRGLYRLRRRAHAGGHDLPHADGQDLRRRAAPLRGGPALRHRAHGPHHRRRHGELCHGGRRHHRGARRPGGLCRPARDRADHAQAPAQRLPALGVPARARLLRPHRRAHGDPRRAARPPRGRRPGGRRPAHALPRGAPRPSRRATQARPGARERLRHRQAHALHGPRDGARAARARAASAGRAAAPSR